MGLGRAGTCSRSCGERGKGSSLLLLESQGFPQTTRFFFPGFFCRASGHRLPRRGLGMESTGRHWFVILRKGTNQSSLRCKSCDSNKVSLQQLQRGS